MMFCPPLDIKIGKNARKTTRIVFEQNAKKQHLEDDSPSFPIMIFVLN
jgi:hypothetical protein